MIPLNKTSSETPPTISPPEQPLSHDKDTHRNLESARAAQMTWGLHMTYDAINTSLLNKKKYST